MSIIQEQYHLSRNFALSISAFVIRSEYCRTVWQGRQTGFKHAKKGHEISSSAPDFHDLPNVCSLSGFCATQSDRIRHLAFAQTGLACLHNPERQRGAGLELFLRFKPRALQHNHVITPGPFCHIVAVGGRHWIWFQLTSASRPTRTEKLQPAVLCVGTQPSQTL